MTRDKITLLSGNAHPQLARSIAESLGLDLCRVTVGRFPDGEIDVKIYEDLRGSDVFIIQPTSPPVNDHLIELLLLLDTCRRASAGRMTAVIPYFGYARKDRKDEGRVPISAKLVANMITTAGADRVLMIDLHAAQIQGFFDLPVDHLYAKPVLIDYFKSLDPKDPVIVAPDMGGLKRARAYAEALGAQVAIVDKRRISADKVDWEHIIGEVAGKDALIIDDMIATGGSMVQAVRIVKERGARRVYVGATHAVFCGDAVHKLAHCGADGIVITDTVPVHEPLPAKFQYRSVAPLLARAITAIHQSESVSALFDKA
ncbi:MAG: ribose-phosphate pyrophosphokinase [Planctomycetes bacterium]|nr:ribose-phosphate pyrophosphokinase [Planctomycetota bacterium]